MLPGAPSRKPETKAASVGVSKVDRPVPTCAQWVVKNIQMLRNDLSEEWLSVGIKSLLLGIIISSIICIVISAVISLGGQFRC